MLELNAATLIAMFTKGKVTELFCSADDFCKFFFHTFSAPQRGHLPNVVSFAPHFPHK